MRELRVKRRAKPIHGQFSALAVAMLVFTLTACGTEAQDNGQQVQAAYESGWYWGQVSACEWIFDQSPDGVLYSAGVGYDWTDCEASHTPAGSWEDSSDPYGDLESNGESDGWRDLCSAFLDSEVGGELFWGDGEVVVGLYDCEDAAP